MILLARVLAWLSFTAPITLGAFLVATGGASPVLVMLIPFVLAGFVAGAMLLYSARAPERIVRDLERIQEAARSRNLAWHLVPPSTVASCVVLWLILGGVREALTGGLLRFFGVL